VSDDSVISGPWIRHSRQVAYSNDWITVWHDEVTRPDGAAGIYGVVHFANLAVGVVALDDSGRILLVGQHRYALDEPSWEIPEGGVPSGEDALDGARRELREETGVDAEIWTELGRLHLSNSISDEAAVLFLATDLRLGEAKPEGTEVLTTAWLPLADALAMTLDGRITDALSIVGIQRLALARVVASGDGDPNGDGDATEGDGDAPVPDREDAPPLS
jgi:8-oxo-dGTP pyrophosphatase MutT (NUDIX family)